MGILSFLKSKKKTEPQTTKPVASEGNAVQERKPVRSKGSGGGGSSGKGVLFLLVGLLVGGVGGFAGGSFEPSIFRDLFSLEPLVPQSELLQAQVAAKRAKDEAKKVAKIEPAVEKERAERPGRRAFASQAPSEIEDVPNVRERRIPREAVLQEEMPREPRDVGRYPQREPENFGRKPMAMNEDVMDRPSQPRQRPREYIDEMGTRTDPGSSFIRSKDLAVRGVVPEAQRNANISVDFKTLTIAAKEVQDILRIRNDGVHFFLRFDCDYCREAYALASNLHMQYPDMPIGMTFFVTNAKQVLLYGAWAALKVINEEEAWNLLNFAFNSPDRNDSQKVLSAYENVTPKFNLNDLITFWREHRQTLRTLIDGPFDEQQRLQLEKYKVPFVTVFGRIQNRERLDLESLRRSYTDRIQNSFENPSPFVQERQNRSEQMNDRYSYR